MNVSVAPTQSPAPSRRQVAKAPWIVALLSPVGFVVLMETFEALAMIGAAPDIPDAVGNAIYFALIAAFPAAVITLGVRAIRRGERGLPWIPTAMGIVMAIGWVVMVVAAIVVG